VANLDFLSDSEELIAVNEAWWREDGEDHSSLGFYIAQAETKHLVIASVRNGHWFAIEKRYSRSWGRDMPIAIELPLGRWRLKVDLMGDGLRQTYYLVGRITTDTSSSWSSPTATLPPEWNAKKS
jgi:hypothetical protein